MGAMRSAVPFSGKSPASACHAFAAAFAAHGALQPAAGSGFGCQVPADALAPPVGADAIHPATSPSSPEQLADDAPQHRGHQKTSATALARLRICAFGLGAFCMLWIRDPPLQ